MSLRKGERHGQHTLEDDEVKLMRSMYQSTITLARNDPNRWTYARLREHFGDVSRQTIYKAITRKTYEWVE